MVRQNGQAFYVNLNSSLEMDERGAIVNARIVARDITERKQMEGALLHAQKIDSIGNLAGGIAHDFNNILMGILGNAALALMRLPENSSGRESLLEIEKAARRAADLSMQMLAYSGKGKFLIGPIDLNKLVARWPACWRSPFQRRYCSDLGMTSLFEGDPTQVRQIVMNPITTHPGDRRENGSITLSTGVTVCDRSYIDSTNEVLLASYDAPLPEGRYVFLDVSDTGCGMNEDTRRKIFDPFFTTKFTGRGLGMAAVLGILRGHRGAIRIYSEVGKGTTIRVLFPAGEGIAVQQAGEEKAAAEELRGAGTVLLVDDDRTVCAVGSELLKHLGFTVLTAPDGKKALEVFRAHAGSIVAVLLDLTMPQMGGEEVFSELHRLQPDVKVVLCSGFTEQDATTRMSGKGLAGFLQKPYDIARLSRVLKQALGEEKVLPSR
jgi:signal transduction histidine kinase/CheY-like chemotaxis protein